VLAKARWKKNRGQNSKKATQERREQTCPGNKNVKAQGLEPSTSPQDPRPSCLQTRWGGRGVDRSEKVDVSPNLRCTAFGKRGSWGHHPQAFSRPGNKGEFLSGKESRQGVTIRLTWGKTHPEGPSLSICCSEPL